MRSLVSGRVTLCALALWLCFVPEARSAVGVSLGLESTDFKITDDLVVFLISEDDFPSTDLNGDGDSADNVAYAFLRDTKLNLRIAPRALVSVPPVNSTLIDSYLVGPTVAAFAVYEMDQGSRRRRE